MSTIRIHPSRTVMKRIRQKANRHGTTESALVMAIIRTAFLGNLVEAILDGAAIDKGASAINRDGWTAERVAELHSRAADGQSCVQIAGALKISKNAVIGKCRREGVELLALKNKTAARVRKFSLSEGNMFTG